MRDVVWIAESADLERAIADLAGSPAIAVDTEFERTRTFYPRPALVQISDGRRAYLVDPLAVADTRPLAALLTAPSVTKILHSGSEDFEIFQVLCAVVPEPIFDTQIAAALVGVGYSLSYQNLVEAVLNRRLSKAETRSNWLERPLSGAQLRYAADDVLLLPSVYRTLHARLADLGRLEWLEEDCQRMVRAAGRTEPLDAYHLRIRGVQRLAPRARAALRLLVAWREGEARRRDRPRAFVLPDEALRAIAERLPRDRAALTRLFEVPRRAVRRHGGTLLRLVGQALARDEGAFDEPLPPPLTAAEGDVLKRLRAAVRATAADLGVVPEVLLRRRDMEALAYRARHDAAASLQGWRQLVLGDAVRQAVRSLRTLPDS